ncbi:MAG: LacI family transcriptional regulator [Opitutaceae bacterium]|jgi:LacI family transcriptional regulator|nr:LacI family transcriptional regulator [Opitutaceae bacterium]
MISSLELAALCGVSQGTIDRALHNRPGISAATRARILAMAEQHGYVPNPVARELMGLAASTVVGAIVSAAALRAPFFMALFEVLARRLHVDGLQLSFWVAPDDADGMRKTFIESAARRQRALILVMPPIDLELPAVTVARQPVLSLILPCSCPGVVSLLPDERAAGRVATEHLLALGHERILHLTGRTPVHGDHLIRHQRRDGYVAAMHSAGLPPLVWDEGVEAPDLLERLRAADITAVFCHNDPDALPLIRRLRAAGLAVPADISVIGVDRSPILVDIDPSLTSVTYPYAGLAEQVASTLSGRPLPPLPAPQVALGASTGNPAR